MTKDEALRMALEALEEISSYYMSLPKKGCMALAAIEEALAEQPTKEKASQSANCEAPGWINSDHARRDDCITEQSYPDNFIDALMYDVAKRDSEAQQAYEDAFVNGTGVMIGDKRIDPASIYKEPEQEPVAWMHPDGRIWTFGRGFDKSTFTIPLYTTPPQRKPLTDEQIKVGWRTLPIQAPMSWSAYLAGARMAEAAHGIKE